jgi:hypothetical protein
MSGRDLTLVQGAVKPQAEHPCLLTGEPCGLVKVRLRRMFLLLTIWIGWDAVVLLPLAKRRSLIGWQYLRMFRPYILFLTFILLMFSVTAGLQLTPGSREAQAALVGVLGVEVALWLFLGHLLNKFEYVRLIWYRRSKGTATIRFSTPELAENASGAVLLTEDTGWAFAAFPLGAFSFRG